MFIQILIAQSNKQTELHLHEDWIDLLLSSVSLDYAFCALMLLYL